MSEYKPILNLIETEVAIKFIKDTLIDGYTSRHFYL